MSESESPPDPTEDRRRAGTRAFADSLVRSIDGADRRLDALREDASRRRAALALAVVVGVATSTMHWLGLVAGGALVGLTRRSLPRAVAAGVGFGAIIVVVFLVTAPGSPPSVFDRTPTLSALSVAVALLAPAWGALVRGVV